MTALCSGKICTIFPEKGALNLWKACTIALEYSIILNSDQGCQFTSNEYMNFLKENQIRQSMDGKNRWADNIMIERWFRSFKYEEAYLTQYNNIREARKAIGKYVHTYNFERCHSALNNQTPASCYYPILLLDDHAA